jgi:hypothetical protein
MSLIDDSIFEGIEGYVLGGIGSSILVINDSGTGIKEDVLFAKGIRCYIADNIGSSRSDMYESGTGNKEDVLFEDIRMSGC